MVVFMTSNGCPRVETSNIFKPEPSSKLLNLTGFFSSFSEALAATDMMTAGRGDAFGVDQGRTKAIVRLLRLREV